MAAPVNTVRTTSECVVRRAAEMDEELLLHWRNEPWVVALGASQRAVTAAEHHLWFAEALRQQERELFLIEIGGK